jgi:hypothetical protein
LLRRTHRGQGRAPAWQFSLVLRNMATVMNTFMSGKSAGSKRTPLLYMLGKSPCSGLGAS